MQESILRVEVLDAFSALSMAITNLCDAVRAESKLLAWVQETDLLFPTSTGIPNERDKAIAVISQLQYLDAQAPREIIVCAGFIGSSDNTLNLANTVNECKDRFKKSILALKAAKITTTHTLKKMGLARLHLKQCYRKIPILHKIPQKIRWTWAHTRAIKRITMAQALALLEKKGTDAGIQFQIQKLSTLSPHEHLAIVQELAPHLRANIVFPPDIIPHRLMIKGPMPIFFPCDVQATCPDFKPPSKKMGKDMNRSIRSDVRLDPIPFLPAIRAHRYVANNITMSTSLA